MMKGEEQLFSLPQMGHDEGEERLFSIPQDSIKNNRQKILYVILKGGTGEVCLQRNSPSPVQSIICSIQIASSLASGELQINLILTGV